MINYFEKEFETAADAKTYAIARMTDRVVGKQVVEKRSQQVGTITKIYKLAEVARTHYDYMIEVRLPDDIKTYYLFKALELGGLVLVDSIDIADIIEENTKLYTAEQEEIAAQEQAEYDARQAEYDAKKAAEEKKKLEEKIQKAKNNALVKVTKIGKTKILTNDDFYTGLGYVAKHAKSIQAAMPDYLENWFISTFGQEAEHRVVDSTKRTVGGYAMQWDLSMVVNLDTNENIPSCLVKYLTSQNKKVRHIANTDYVYDLVYNYGFKFGKEQDLEAIRDNIPTNKLEDFDLGYSA